MCAKQLLLRERIGGLYNLMTDTIRQSRKAVRFGLWEANGREGVFRGVIEVSFLPLSANVQLIRFRA